MSARALSQLILLALFGASESSFALGKYREQDERKLIKENRKIADKIDAVAQDIDIALSGGKIFVKKKNQTTITVRNQAAWTEGGNYSYSPHLDIALHLPNVEEKWKLKFTTYDQDQEIRGINKNRLRTRPQNRAFGGNIGWLQKLGRVNIEYQPRVEYRDSLQLSQILKLTTSLPTDYFSFNPEAQFFARTDNGVGQYVGLNVDIPFSKIMGLTVINEEQYLDRVNEFSTNSGVALGHSWTERMSQNYTIIFESSSRPNYHLDRYTTASTLTHRYFPGVFHYAVTPFLAFPRHLNFKGSPGISVEVDIIF